MHHAVPDDFLLQRSDYKNTCQQPHLSATTLVAHDTHPTVRAERLQILTESYQASHKPPSCAEHHRVL